MWGIPFRCGEYLDHSKQSISSSKTENMRITELLSSCRAGGERVAPVLGRRAGPQGVERKPSVMFCDSCQTCKGKAVSGTRSPPRTFALPTFRPIKRRCDVDASGIRIVMSGTYCRFKLKTK